MAQVTTDHDTIREWVEERGGWPATVQDTGTEEDPGILRIDFPGYSGEERLTRISWDAFFEAFEENDLAFLYEQQASGGETSRFSKFTRRDSKETEQKGYEMNTQAKKPPMEVTKAAKEKHLQMAQAQGEAVEKALHEMTSQVAQGGAEEPAGNYLVGYAVEKAEGMYVPQDGGLKWQEPQEENAHFEVSVRDGADGRFIPGLNVQLTVIDSEGKRVGTHRQPFIWHPWLYHYGRNWKLPGSGEYTLQVHIDPPDFARHDKKNGQRYAEPVDIEFTGVHVETGKA